MAYKFISQMTDEQKGIICMLSGIVLFLYTVGLMPAAMTYLLSFFALGLIVYASFLLKLDKTLMKLIKKQ